MAAKLRQVLSDDRAGEQNRETSLADVIHPRFAPFGGVELAPHPGYYLDE